MRYAQLVMGPAGSGKVGIVKNMSFVLQQDCAGSVCSRACFNC